MKTTKEKKEKKETIKGIEIKLVAKTISEREINSEGVAKKSNTTKVFLFSLSNTKFEPQLFQYRVKALANKQRVWETPARSSQLDNEFLFPFPSHSFFFAVKIKLKGDADKPTAVSRATMKHIATFIYDFPLLKGENKKKKKKNCPNDSKKKTH